MLSSPWGVPEELGMKKSEEEYLPAMYLDWEEGPRPRMGGWEKGGRGQVQVVFCLAVNKRT